MGEGKTQVAQSRASAREVVIQMTKLTSEFELKCPCCQATLIVDANLKRVTGHREPEHGQKPELSEAARILAEEAARREARFARSVESERSRGDELAKRFEEALRQAREEPISRPSRDFDLD